MYALASRCQKLCRHLLILVGLACLVTALLSVVAIPLSHARGGTSYYVDSVHGSDSNPGTSPRRPWKTLAPVNSHRYQPGDSVNFLRGSAWDTELMIRSSGVSGNPIKFQAYGTGAAPIFRHGGDNSRAVSIDASWVIVDGLQVRTAHVYGILIAPAASHNLIRNCEAIDVGIGIGVYGQYNVITQNSIHDLHMVVNTPGGDDDSGAVGVGLFGSNNEISYNQMHNCIAPSYDYQWDGGAVEVFGNVSNSFIHHNWASDNKGFMEIGGGTITNNRVAYNVMLNNGWLALFNLQGTYVARVQNFQIDNNTIVETVDHAGASGYWNVALGFDGEPTTNMVILRNNIFYLEDTRLVSNKQAFTHNNNLYYLNNPYYLLRLAEDYSQLGFPLGSGERIADPLFFDLAGDNFHLAAGSPAIKAAVNLGYTSDFDGQPLPANVPPDIGAYQYVPNPPAVANAGYGMVAGENGLR